MRARAGSGWTEYDRMFRQSGALGSREFSQLVEGNKADRGIFNFAECAD